MKLSDARKLAQLVVEQQTLHTEMLKLRIRDPQWQAYADARTLIGDEIAKIVKRG